MKKLLLVFVCLLMVLGTVGCGSEPVMTGDAVTLTFWGHQNDPWNAAWRDAAVRFNEKYPNITIDFEFFPYDDFEAKVMASLIDKEQGADIYELWGGWGVDFVPNGTLAALPDELATMIKEEFYEPTFGALEHEGKIYGFPLEFNIESGAMLVNKKLAEKYGVSIPTTWDGMINEAQKAVEFKGKNMTQKGFDFVNWDGVPYLFTSMILSKGGSYRDASGNFTFNTEIGQDAYQALYNLIKIRKVTDMEGLVGGDDIEGYQQLFVDAVLFVPRGPWVIAEGEDEFDVYYGVDFDYVPMPWYGGTPGFASETGWSVAINSGSAQQEAAFLFLDFISSDDILEAHNIACAQIPAKKSVAQDPELLEKMPFAAPLVGILDDAVFIGLFNTDIYKEEINNNFQAFVSGKYKTAEAALKALDADMNKAINE